MTILDFVEECMSKPCAINISLFEEFLLQFDTVALESRQAATVVLMLSSPEDEVQAKSCDAIYKFVEKCKLVLSRSEYYCTGAVRLECPGCIMYDWVNKS